MKSNHVSIYSALAAILSALLLPAAITHIRRITLSYINIDCSIQYSMVTIACVGLQSLWKIAFLSRPKVGRWPSDIDGKVGPPQQQLGFLFFKMQVAFIYV